VQSSTARVGILLIAPVLIIISACGTADVDGTPACGWDLRTDAGRQANSERLTFANEWIGSNPGVPVPAPSSTFWHGVCPVPAQPPAPPDNEGDRPEG
jgi:hypothetical protein